MKSEWPTVTLSEVCETITDGAHFSPVEDPDGLPMASVKDMTRFGIEVSSCKRIPKDDFEMLKRQGCMPRMGDVLIAKDGNSALDTVCVHKLEEEIVLLSSVAILRPNKRIDSLFLKYYLESPATRNLLKDGFRSGSAIPRVVLKDFRRAPVTLPPLPEQRAIAAVLGALDDKIELNRRMNATLEGLARALFRSWFVDFDPVRAKMDRRHNVGAGLVPAPEGPAQEGNHKGLPLPPAIDALFPDEMEVGEDGGERPRGWGITTIGNLARIVGGSTPSTKEPRFWNDGKYYWTTPKDLSSLTVPVLLGSERKITDQGLKQISSGLLPQGTVLLSSRAPIGYLAISEVPTAVNQGFIAMLPNEGVSNVFLMRWAEMAHDDIVARANGSTFLEISKTNFRPIELLVPPDEIMAAFDRVARPLHERIVINERQSRTLAALRDGLLPGLMSGAVRVTQTEEAMTRAL